MALADLIINGDFNKRKKEEEQQEQIQGQQSYSIADSIINGTFNQPMQVEQTVQLPEITPEQTVQQPIIQEQPKENKTDKVDEDKKFSFSIDKPYGTTPEQQANKEQRLREERASAGGVTGFSSGRQGRYLTDSNEFKKMHQSYFDDGYDFGDITRTLIDGGKNIGVGILSGIEGAGNSLNRAFRDLFGKEQADNTKIQNMDVSSYNRLVENGTPEEKQYYLNQLETDYKNNDIEEKMYKMYKNALTTEDTRSDTVKTINDILGGADYQQTQTYKDAVSGNLDDTNQFLFGIGSSIGNMLPSMATSALISPAAGSAMFFTQAQQNYTEEAKQRGYSDGEARLYGLIMGGVETVVERLGFDELGGLGKMSADSLVKAASGEAMEEFVTPYIDSTVRMAFGEDFDLESTTKDALEGATMAAITAAVMNGGSKGIVKVDNVINKANKGQQITTEELVDAAKELQKKDPDYINRYVTESTKGIVESQENVEKLQEQPIQTQEQVEQPQIPTQTPLNTLNQGVQEENIQIPYQTQTPQITPLNEVNQELQETRQNDVANTVQAMNLEKQPEFKQKEGNYVYEKSENSKIDNLRKDMAKNFTESEETSKFAKTLEKIIEDKNIEIRFDPNLRDSQGRMANGSYSDGVITLNPNSNRAGEFLTIHELTHAIGTQPMIDMIQKYRNSNAEFDSAVQKLLTTYKTTEINEEALADISGQLFGNQEYINSLSMENPSLFKKIYNEIKYLWHQFRGYKNQDQFIEDLRNKWESAYRNQKVQQKAKNSNIEMSTQTDSNGNMLSNEQVDYFKDSKVRDENGNLLEVYHGTPNGGFTIFDRNKTSRAEIKSQFGTGFYFTNNSRAASDYNFDEDIYGNYTSSPNAKTYKVYLDIENPLVIEARNANEHNLDRAKIKELLLRGDNDYFFDEYIPFITNTPNELNYQVDGLNEEQIKSLSKEEKVDYWLRGTYDLQNFGDKSFLQSMYRAYKNNSDLLDNFKDIFGYDGIIVNSYNGRTNQYIAFDSSQIKNIDNLTPTQDDDIRYSINEEIDNSSFSLDKNAKRYEDLEKTRYIEYFTKDNGDVRINLMDSNNNLVNQLDLYNQREAIKELGEELGKQIYQTSNEDNQIYTIGNDINNLGKENDYFMSHRPTETGITADDLTKKGYEVGLPNDIYEHPEYYSINEKTAKETMDQLNKVRNNPDADITIYRATTGDSINKGDWITLSKSYAEQHNESQFNGKGNIVEKVVKAKDIQHAGDALEEWGYFPKNDTKYSIEEVKKEPTKDNTGRELSKGQQEYFKDSKIRNDKGELIPLYHGTHNDFTIFDKNYIGSNTNNEGIFGKGFYFTNDNKLAESYDRFEGHYYPNVDHNVMELYADMKKPFIWNEIDTKEKMQQFIEETGMPKYVLGWNNTLKNQMHPIIDPKAERKFSEVLQKNGYDGIIYYYNDRKGTAEYVVFEPNQIKNVDNLNPTEDPDIRYSKDNQTWREYLEKEFPSQGTRTNLQDINERNKPLNKEEKTELDGLRALVDTGLMNKEETTRLRELERRNNIKDTTKALNLEKETKPKYSINENAKDDYVSMKVDKAIQKNAYKNLNVTTKAAENYLKFNREQKSNFKDSLLKFVGKTKEQLANAKTYNQIKDLVNNYANVEYNYIDEELKNIKSEIRKTKINIPKELRQQITDYSDFRKQSKLNISKDGQNIDSIWQELSNDYPHIFDSSIQTEADMLYALSDLMNKDIKVTKKYRIPDADLKYAVTKIQNSLIDNALTQEELNNIEKDLQLKAERRTRQVVQQELLNKMNIKLDDIETGKDIKSINYQITDPRRVNEKVFSPETAQKINDATVNFVSEQEAKSNKFKNKERDEIKDLGIKARSKESAAVQKYGEKEWINDKGELLKYGDEQLAREFPNKQTQEKIKNAAKVLREKYDNYIDKINVSLEEMGYDPIPKRKDYFKHFYEIGDKLSQWGVPFNANDMSSDLLPTDINGLTDEFKPGKNWFASAQQRTGKKTVYDAITGIDQYLEGASNLIFHTESIQRYRTLSKFIRETYGQMHGLDNVANLSEEEINKRIQDIQDNKLSGYAAWLDEQANALAGKKGKIDRGVEEFAGRKIYSALNTLKKQVGSNMTGFNVRSAMTNFASAVQGASKVKKTAFLKGTLSTIQNIIHKDGLIDKSNFLTNRFGSDSLSKKAWQKVSNAGQIFMTGTDWFTANQIWRSKYFENMSKGMSEKQAIKGADDFAARIMGDRSKGQTASMFNSKTLGFLTQFQLEVNNQWQSMIHDNKMDIKTGAKSGGAVIFQLGQLAAMSNLFNLMMKGLTGSDVMFDPIDILKDIINPDDDDKDKDITERAREALGKVVDQLPMANIITGGGRIPISEALEGLKTTGKFIIRGKNKYGQKVTLEDVKKDLLESLPYWIMPTGWGQARKTINGVEMYTGDKPVAGSYTDKGNLRFTADTSLAGKTKAALFGAYSSQEAQDYIKGGFKTITKGNNLEELKNLGYTSTEYKKYRQELNAAGRKNQDKMDYILSLDIPKKEKDIMASRLLRKEVNTDEIKNFETLADFNKWYKKTYGSQKK